MTPTPSCPAATATGAVVLRDGTPVTIRPMRADDDHRLIDFHRQLSPESQRLRFFTPHPTLSATEVHWFTHVDGHQRVALVAEHDGDIVAVARYDRLPDTNDAEAAFVVRDDHQGHGICTLLLNRLASHAAHHGVGRFVAETLPDNTRMLHVFHNHSPAVTTRFTDGTVHVTVPLNNPTRAVPTT
jgi:RimJ/RimL family protein N-acetyltransferase